MDPNYHPCSLTFELKLIQARNVYPKSPHQEIFVRCYLPIGNAKRAILESQAIPSHSNSRTWDQTFSLQCSGTQDTIKCLKQKTIEFELRYRTHVPTCMGRMKKGSKLVGRAEMPWKEIVEAPGSVEMEKWVVMIPKNGWVVNHGDVVKPPAVQMAMKVVKELRQEKGMKMKKEEIGERRVDDESCRCKTCVAYEFLAIEAALEGF